MKPFCEIVVSDFLPSVRAIIANDLSNKYDLTQTQISEKLGITQPAISQYKRELRGHKVRAISSNNAVSNLISELSKDIAMGDVDCKFIHKKVCEICRTARKEKLLCKIHSDYNPLLDNCNLCSE